MTIDINELRRLAQATNEHSDDRAEILAEFYAATQSDTIIEILDRLEAAEKERDELRATIRHEADCVDAAKAEIETLRAKIEQMENQEVFIWYDDDSGDTFTVGSINDGIDTGDSLRPLFALAGAQSVPTSLLVAIADLVTQMEIIARVGFVDTPDDKDSCAAFCVAEGTWLELMSCVESLAASLEAAQGAQPAPKPEGE